MWCFGVVLSERAVELSDVLLESVRIVEDPRVSGGDACCFECGDPKCFNVLFECTECRVD